VYRPRGLRTQASTHRPGSKQASRAAPLPIISSGQFDVDFALASINDVESIFNERRLQPLHSAPNLICFRPVTSPFLLANGLIFAPYLSPRPSRYLQYLPVHSLQIRSAGDPKPF
jgi:hypothetical protein